MDEVVSIKSAYYSLGRSLGLPAGELNAVRRQCPGDVEQALNDILLLWLQQKYNVIKYGVPSWRMLVKAVDKESGGNNHAVAKRIASNHPFTGVCTCHIIQTYYVYQFRGKYYTYHNKSPGRHIPQSDSTW